MVPSDIDALRERESEQVEWKERVADPNDVVRTLVAFANDLQNLGGGYVVCGVREDKDASGFPTSVLVGLSAAELRRVEGEVLARCRDRVTPSLAPRVDEVRLEEGARRLLIFTMAATRHAHVFRSAEDSGKHYVRVGRETREARNGLLLELLGRKGDVEGWDRRASPTATVDDIDLLALRDGSVQLGLQRAGFQAESLLSDTVQIHALVPPLCVREPLTGVLRPRNVALLLFGRTVQREFPGAYAVFSRYPGVDRSDSAAQRQEVVGSLLDQIRALRESIRGEIVTVFDKTDPDSPHASSYPERAVREALVNALAHRDYTDPAPVRVTAFLDRLELWSPGGLVRGVGLDDLRSGRATPLWRNQTLAWFLQRLALAEGEGQGVATIQRTMADAGNPAPIFEATDVWFRCTLPAHPRHVAYERRRRGSA